MQKKVPSPGVAPAAYWLSSGALLMVSKIGGSLRAGYHDPSARDSACHSISMSAVARRCRRLESRPMGPISAATEIDVPRERAFEAIADLSLRPAFTDHFLKSFHLTRIEPRGVGAGARFRIEASLRKVWMDTTIVELDEPHLIVERGQGGRNNRIPNNAVWELTEGPGTLTTVRVAHWTEPGPTDRALEILSMASVWQQRGWSEAMDRLREGLESGAWESERVAVAGGNRYATGIP